MLILDRLIGNQKPKIPIHGFMALLSEYKRGQITKNEIVSILNLNNIEQNELKNFFNDVNNINRDMLHDVLILGELGYYTKDKIIDRLNI
jgi:hypothetical protein